jgi:polysaccharide export outer membrane protein
MSKLSNKIFVVDDNRFHLELMSHILQSNGNENILLFENGIDCLLEIHQQPEIVFLDHQMDVYSGYETLQKIKRYNPNIFVIMVSGQEKIETAVNSLKHGAFDYIQKDENLEEKVLHVMQRLEEVKALLKARKPSFLNSLLQLV